MTDTRKIQLGVEVDPSGAKAGFAQVNKAADEMGDRLNQAGKKAGEGMEKVGDGGERAKAKIEGSTRSIISSIERATAAAQAGERGTAQYFETLARQRGVSADALKPYIEQLRQAEIAQRAAGASLDRMGVSAGQTANALRQVPAQFTDIVTSLQAGQSPLQVLLQQGGQLKDSFGGAGAAAQALGGYIVSLINPMTVLAAAAGTLAFGFIAGAKEGEAFRRTLIETGGVLGLSSSQLSDMSERLGNLAGGQGKAAAALNTFAASARVGADNIERFTAAAVQLERVGGQSVEETAKAFAELRKEPLAALLKLNEGTNFLTASVVEQVRALEQQGRSTDAARVAQDAYADTIEDRTPRIAENLGTVERLWRGIKDGAVGALNAIKEVGRDTTLAQEVAREAERNRRLRAATVSNQSPLKNGDGFFFTQAGLDAARKESDELLDRLRQSVALQEQVAAAEGESARQGQARAKWAADGEKFLTSQLRMQREIADIERQGLAAGAARADIEQRIAIVREKYAKQNGAGATRELDQEASLLEKLAGLTGTYQRNLDELQRSRQRGTLTEQQYIAAVQELIEKQPVVIRQRKEEAAAAEQVANAQERGEDAYRKYIQTIAKSADQVDAQVEALRDEERAAGIAAAKNISLARAIQLVTIARLEERKAQTRDPEEIAQLDREIERRKALMDAIYSKENRERVAEAARDSEREWKRAAEQIEQSLTDALLRGFESGKGFAENLRDTLVNMFKTLVLRPTIQAILAPITGGIASLLGSSGASASTGGAGGLLSSANQVGGLLGLIRNGAGGVSSLTALGGQGSLGSFFSLGANGALSGSTLEALTSGVGAIGNGAVGGGLAQIGGALTPWAALGALGYYGGRAISDGFSIGGAGRSGNSTSNALALGGAAIYGPLGAAVGGLLGGAVNRLFGRRAKEYGETRLDGMAGADGFSGQAAADWFQKGGLFRSDKRGTDLQPLDVGTEQVLDTAIGQLYGITSDYAKILGLPVEAVKGYSASFKVVWGKTEEENKAALDAALTNLREQLAGVYSAQLTQFQRAGETLGETIDRLAGLQIFSNNLNELGGVFSRVAGLSVDARENMISLAGGVEQFSKSALSFVQEYYSRDEIAGLKAREIQGVLQGAGITTDINSREQFRSIVEGLDVSTEAGRKQLATLLGISGSFTSVADYLSETGTTLSQAAAGAPELGSLGPLLAGNNAQVAATNEVRDATLEVRDAVDRLTEYMAGWGSLPTADIGIGTTRRINLPEVGLA